MGYKDEQWCQINISLTRKILQYLEECAEIYFIQITF